MQIAGRFAISSSQLVSFAPTACEDGNFATFQQI
jgi:hypothetical protein